MSCLIIVLSSLDLEGFRLSRHSRCGSSALTADILGPHCLSLLRVSPFHPSPPSAAGPTSLPADSRRVCPLTSDARLNSFLLLSMFLLCLLSLSVELSI